MQDDTIGKVGMSFPGNSHHMFIFRVLLLFLTLMAPPVLRAAEPVKVAYQVICEDRAVAEKLSLAVAARLKKANLDVTDRFPSAKLFIYAQQDVNDRVNTDGWSFAIVHASNLASYFLASKLMSSEAPAVNDVKPVLLNMVREDGLLTYMNVAHADRLTPENIDRILESVVTSFAQRVK